MIPLLKMYDDFTSNKYVSIGATVASTAFMAYRIVKAESSCCECDGYWFFFNSSPLVIAVSLCAGVIFAVIANRYLVQNMKTEGEKNSVYATISLFVGVSESSLINYRIWNLLFYGEGYFYEVVNDVFGGTPFYKLSFLVTTLALQILEGKTKFKFQSPFVFE